MGGGETVLPAGSAQNPQRKKNNLQLDFPRFCSTNPVRIFRAKSPDDRTSCATPHAASSARWPTRLRINAGRCTGHRPVQTLTTLMGDGPHADGCPTARVWRTPSTYEEGRAQLAATTARHSNRISAATSMATAYPVGVYHIPLVAIRRSGGAFSTSAKRSQWTPKGIAPRRPMVN